MDRTDRVKVFCRLRTLLPEDDQGSGGGESAFLTPQDEGEATCFDVFDGRSGECVYRRPADGAGADGRRFKFDGLLEPGCGQDEVFDAVAMGIVDGCLEGYNGAVLAYGQTGSGKTHSMRGADGPGGGSWCHSLSS